MLLNGYTEADLRCCNKSKSTSNLINGRKKKTYRPTLKLPFISDSLVRQINCCIRKYKLDINFVSTGNKQMRNVFKHRMPKEKHSNCLICSALPDKHNCDQRNVIYQFTCKACNSKYIGKTSRPFRDRFNEHKTSINNKDKKSALSEHTNSCSDISSIQDFNINFIRCVRDPIEASLVESRLIDLYKPCLNRRHENVVVSRLPIM